VSPRVVFVSFHFASTSQSPSSPLCSDTTYLGALGSKNAEQAERRRGTTTRLRAEKAGMVAGRGSVRGVCMDRERGSGEASKGQVRFPSNTTKRWWRGAAGLAEQTTE
jgi:hypothetical protein